jgi:hypothetical protein
MLMIVVPCLLYRMFSFSSLVTPSSLPRCVSGAAAAAQYRVFVFFFDKAEQRKDLFRCVRAVHLAYFPLILIKRRNIEGRGTVGIFVRSICSLYHHPGFYSLICRETLERKAVLVSFCEEMHKQNRTRSLFRRRKMSKERRATNEEFTRKETNDSCLSWTDLVWNIF